MSFFNLILICTGMFGPLIFHLPTRFSAAIITLSSVTLANGNSKQDKPFIQKVFCASVECHDDKNGASSAISSQSELQSAIGAHSRRTRPVAHKLLLCPSVECEDDKSSITSFPLSQAQETEHCMFYWSLSICLTSSVLFR